MEENPNDIPLPKSPEHDIKRKNILECSSSNKKHKPKQALIKNQPRGILIKLKKTCDKDKLPELAKTNVSHLFNPDDESDNEEMPKDARMRMKNVGKETPTSAGPNSFNKGKDGFIDYQKFWEKKFKGEL